MGPGIIGANMGAWNVLRRSSGQGETYIFDLAIDLYWLRFLKITDQLDNKRLVDSLEAMNKGLLQSSASFCVMVPVHSSNIGVTFCCPVIDLALLVMNNQIDCVVTSHHMFLCVCLQI